MELLDEKTPLLDGETGYQKGIQAFFSDKTEEAFKHFKTSEAEGFLAARVWLHCLYEDDKKPENEIELLEEAVEWLQKQNQNLAWVQSDLGFCYQTGLGGLDENNEEAIELYKSAAAQDHIPACLNLFHFYSQEGEHRNLKEAFEYAKIAADAGDPEMQCYVADVIGRVLLLIGLIHRPRQQKMRPNSLSKCKTTCH